jgi:hypothetical protein
MTTVGSEAMEAMFRGMIAGAAGKPAVVPKKHQAHSEDWLRGHAAAVYDKQQRQRQGGKPEQA